jgi:hypothetical protein
VEHGLIAAEVGGIGEELGGAHARGQEGRLSAPTP